MHVFHINTSSIGHVIYNKEGHKGNVTIGKLRGHVYKIRGHSPIDKHRGHVD